MLRKTLKQMSNTSIPPVLSRSHLQYVYFFTKDLFIKPQPPNYNIDE